MKSKVKITKETYIWKNEDEDGVIYYKDGKKHREDGPAVEFKNGTNEWWFEDLRHREDGPAIQIPTGQPWWKNEFHRDSFENYWFLNGAELTEEEFNQWLDKKNLNEKLHANLEDKLKIKKGKI